MGPKFILLVLYTDDILLVSSDIGLLHETKIFLSKNFEMKILVMYLLCWAYRFIEIVLEVFLAYHKSHILIKCLVDLA